MENPNLIYIISNGFIPHWWRKQKLQKEKINTEYSILGCGKSKKTKIVIIDQRDNWDELGLALQRQYLERRKATHLFQQATRDI